MSDLPSVELRPAFLFVCNSCGQDSFARSVVLEDPELQARAANAFRDIITATDGEEASEEWDGLISMAPELVTCSHCGQHYQVVAEELDKEILQVFLDDYEDDSDDFESDEFFDEDSKWSESDEAWEDDSDLDESWEEDESDE